MESNEEIGVSVWESDGLLLYCERVSKHVAYMSLKRTDGNIKAAVMDILVALLLTSFLFLLLQVLLHSPVFTTKEIHSIHHLHPNISLFI